MKLKNETNWRTADLRAIVSRIARKETDAATRRSVVVIVRPAKDQQACRWQHGYAATSGVAYINGGWRRDRLTRVVTHIPVNTVTIAMPTVFDTLTAREVVDFCATVAHEFAHIRTRKVGRAVERAMRTSVPYGRPKTDEGRARQDELYAWATAMPLRKQAQPAAVEQLAGSDATPASGLIERRAAKAAATVAKWQKEIARRERALKRARTKLAEAKRRVAYYARRTQQPAG